MGRCHRCGRSPNATFSAGSSGASLNFPAGMLRWVNGRIDGSGPWLNLGSLTVDHTGGVAVVVLGRQFDNAGTLVISGVSPLDLDANAILTNLPGAVLDFQGDGAIFDTFSGKGNLFINKGTIRKSSGTLSNINASGCNNTDTCIMDVRAAVLAVANGRHTAGTLVASAGAGRALTGGMA